jgi:hypothetical protein
VPANNRPAQVDCPAQGKLARNSYSQSAQVGSLSCSRDRDQGRGEPTCASTPDTPTSTRVASCRTNRCNARSPAASITDRGPGSTTPNTSVASQRIVPGEPSGKSITNNNTPFHRLNDFATKKPTEQRVRLGHYPHLTRQDSTQLLQSVAFTPGTGKTHLSVGLARAAAHAGYRTYFTTAADLAARCHRATIEGRWATTTHFYAGPTLLVIDELGYLPLPADAASALFQVVSQRYLKISIVIYYQPGVGAWGDILGDTTVAAAMLDRLLHCSVVINLDGESYRLRDHHAAADTLRRATTGTRQPRH